MQWIYAYAYACQCTGRFFLCFVYLYMYVESGVGTGPPEGGRGVCLRSKGFMVIGDRVITHGRGVVCGGDICMERPCLRCFASDRGESGMLWVVRSEGGSSRVMNLAVNLFGHHSGLHYYILSDHLTSHPFNH